MTWTPPTKEAIRAKRAIWDREAEIVERNSAKIKPLLWVPSPDTDDEAIAKTFCYTYALLEIEDSWIWWVAGLVESDSFDSFESAKEDAEYHWAKIISDCLV